MGLSECFKYQEGATLSRYAIIQCLRKLDIPVHEVTNAVLGRALKMVFKNVKRVGKR